MNIFIRNMSLCAVSTMALLCIAPCSTAAADTNKGEIVFSNDTKKGAISIYGTQKKENYDLAVRIDDAGLVGKTIKGVRIPMTTDKTLLDITDIKVWMTTKCELQIVDGVKVAVTDICSQNVTVNADTIDVTFDTPYTMTADGLYVGYSFSVNTLDDATKRPVLYSTEYHPGSFFIHSSRTFRSWSDVSSTGSLPIQVIIDGADANAATAIFTSTINMEKEKPATTNVRLNNHGYNGVKSLDLEYIVDGKKSEKHINMGDNSVSAIYNDYTTTTIDIAPISTAGSYPINIKVTKVNGVENADTASSTSSINVLDFLPVHRSLMEEYTGTWCGYCPRGFVALEKMNKLYPDDFVALSYHNGDDMEIMGYEKFPSNISGYPSAVIDRTVNTDPYHGDGNDFGIEAVWKECCQKFADANITTAGEVSADASSVKMTSDVTFSMAKNDANYHVEFVLVADDLHNDSWSQSNYFSGSSDYPDPDMDIFTKGESHVNGLHFNDVIVATSRVNGGDANLPAVIEREKPITVEYTFDLAKVVNTKGESLIQDLKKLRVVAILIDNATGAVVNSNKANVNSSLLPDGINNINTSEKYTPEAYYNLSGNKLSSPVSGINIIKTGDGRMVKVLKR